MEQSTSTPLDSAVEDNISQFIEGVQQDPAMLEELERLRRGDGRELRDAFYTHLSFGTGGLRGIMGAGTNRMNPFTVALTTQGLANVLSRRCSNGAAVFVGYDSRHHSQEFAEAAAKVLAGNGVSVYLCRALRPTPFVSFGCRYHRCDAAIMITASHNPPAYNGYKVYWKDGGQVVPPIDAEILAEIGTLTADKIQRTDTLNHPLIHYTGEQEDEAYLEALCVRQTCRELAQAAGNTLRIIYTPLHGTGGVFTPTLLRRWGFTNLIEVAKQSAPDGDFPTVASPNPEEPAALTMGIDTMLQQGGDLLLATDPDADRVAVAVNHDGEVQILSGHQIACICLEHLCKMIAEQPDRFPPRPAFVKTIVTTELFRTICQTYNFPCFDVLPGFKFIAAQILQWEESSPPLYDFIFGGEESFGYLLGDQTRDKDAVIASALLAEIALMAKCEGKTLIDKRDELFVRYGLFVELLDTLSYPETQEGRQCLSAAVEKLRSAPPKTVAGIPVVAVDDYSSGQRLDVASGGRRAVELPTTDALLLTLADGTTILARPSGTEPKIKLYGKGHAPLHGPVGEAETALKQRLRTALDQLKQEIQ